MMTSEDYDKLCVMLYSENAKKAVQRDALKHIMDKPKWNLKKCSSQPEEGRTKKTEKLKTETTNK